MPIAWQDYGQHRVNRQGSRRAEPSAGRPRSSVLSSPALSALIEDVTFPRMKASLFVCSQRGSWALSLRSAVYSSPRAGSAWPWLRNVPRNNFLLYLLTVLADLGPNYRWRTRGKVGAV